MSKGFIVVAILGILGFWVIPDLMGGLGRMFGPAAPASATFTTYTTISDWDEHREMSLALFNGELAQAPNYSAMRRRPDSPLSPTEEHKKGMVLRATSSPDGGDDGRFRFLTIFLFRDPGMTPTKFEFENGKNLHTKTMMIAGYVDLTTGMITYAYAGKGYIRVRPAGPNSVEVESHVVYSCVTGSGTPNRWQADPGCETNLFPESIIFHEAAAGAS